MEKHVALNASMSYVTDHRVSFVNNSLRDCQSGSEFDADADVTRVTERSRNVDFVKAL